MPMSTYKRARPISRVVLRLRIMARISVPPVDAPISKTIALPSDGKITAKHRSSHMSPVIEMVEGITSSKSDT